MTKSEVLNIPVSAPLMRVWNNLFVPTLQPFYISEQTLTESWAAPLLGLPIWKRDELHAYHLPLSVWDTLNLYELAPEATWLLLLDEAGFEALPTETQIRLLTVQLSLRRGGVEYSDAMGQARVWWPQTWKALTPDARWKRLKRFLEDDRLPCRRHDLTLMHRRALRRRFPALIPLLGTFAPDSGPNCLGSVMTACGVPGVQQLWMHGPPFLRWLERVSVPSDDLAAPETVLVWRDADGVLQHAALSLGHGWLFHKEAQAWFAPRQVVRQQGALDRWRHEGWTVSGYALL